MDAISPSSSATPARRRFRWVPLLALVPLGVLTFVASRPPLVNAPAFESVKRSQVVLSEPYLIDRIYKSMMGPWATQQVQLGDVEADELLWITGFSAQMMAADGETPLSQDFMCHSNLDLDTEIHQMLHGPNPSFNPRLFTLSQGQYAVDFPPGFGIPLRSVESLGLTTQVLNLNHEAPHVEVRHRIGLDYVRDVEAPEPMVPLFPVAAFGLALLEGDDGYFGIEEPMAEKHGPGCMVGTAASDHSYKDPQGRSFSGHWQVPPGRQVNRTLVTELMRIPYATTIHFIAVHLHPFAERLILRNLTTGEVVFESRATNHDDRIGLRHVEEFSSADGLAIDPEHEFELESVYVNPTDDMQDSMAVMYIYLRDLEMEKRLANRRSSPPTVGLGVAGG
ncbi:MAG: hypothetical protein AAGN46_07400 [Acidobacteriota bacterium]